MSIAKTLLTLREKLLSLCGCEIWPRKQDPMIKGPQPKVLSPEARTALERAQRETDVVNNMCIKHVDSEMGA